MIRVARSPDKNADIAASRRPRLPLWVRLAAWCALGVASAAVVPAWADGNYNNNQCNFALYGGAGLSIGNNGTINGNNITGSGNSLDSYTGVQSTVTGVTLSPLSPASFPSGGTSPTVASGATLAPGTYNTVTASGNLVLTAGTYYINTLNFGQGFTLSINSNGNDNNNGAVTIYIGASFGAGNINNASINNSGGGGDNGNNGRNLTILLYSGASFNLGNNATFKGLVYSPYSNSTVSFGNNGQITGAIVTGGSVSLGNNSQIQYSGGGDSNQYLYSSYAACGGSGGSGPSAFNAVDTGSSATSGKIGTKTAGVSFNLDLYALNSARTAQDTTFNGAVLVDLLANTATGVALDSNGCPTSSTALTIGTMTLASGKLSASIGAVSNAWRDVRVRLRYPATGTVTVTGCSSDNFAVKPAALSVQASDATPSTPGTSNILNSSVSSGTPVHKAGQPFTLTVTAYSGAASPAITSNYNGAVSVSTIAAISPASVTGTFSIGSASAISGSLVSTTATYSEVGSASVALQDTTFAAVDAGDGTAASCAGYYVCSSAATIGRFVPDHFAATAGAPVAACNGFTYFGEDFSTPFTLTAQNAANATTQNYTGTLAKLVLTSWGNFVFTASGAPAGSTLNGGATAPSGTWSNGLASVSASQNVSAPATPAAPTSVTILALPVDADGATMASATAVTSATATLYQGRARMSNAIGPETTDLPVPFQVEYWRSAIAGWQRNTSDTCTHASIQITSGTLAATATCVRDTGNPGNSGAGCAGAAPVAIYKYLQGGVVGTDSNLVAGFAGNFNLWLKASGAGNLGTVTVTGSVPSWLQYNWTGTVGNPSATATFGMSGTSPILYRSEHF